MNSLSFFFVLVVGQLMWFSSACLLCCQCGSFLPNDPFYYTNKTSDLLCALDKPNAFVNASDLYITFYGVEEDPSYMTVINETAVSFKKVMRKEDDGEYTCRIRGLTGNAGVVGTISLKVDDPVEPVNEIQCMWHNWKDKLVCTWSLPPYRYMQYIKVDLTWYNGATSKCPDMENKTVCTWRTRDAALDTSPWYFRLTVYNTEHKNDSAQGDWILKPVKDNVKPNAVESFQLNWTNESTCLLLTWVYDRNIAHTRKKYFRIQYFPVADPSQNNTVWSDEYNLTVCNLTPYMLYKFTIAVHPDRNAVKGFWSDPVTNQTCTDQDIPNRSPEMVGYTQSSDMYLKEEVNITSYTIFWKSVPEVDRNGIITRYNITYTPAGVHHTEVIIKNGSDKSVYLELPYKKLYNISISAATIKGYSPHHSSLIINTTAMPPLDVMVERNDSLYNVSWSLPGPVDSLTSFSVVYCVQLGSQQECSGELQKLSIPDSKTRHQTLSLSSDTTYLFGVSIIRAGVASAAKFESCVYVVTETPNAPQFSVDGSIGENSLRVVWDPISCNNKQPYVRSFTITWCQTDRKLEDQCNGQEQSVVILSTSKTEYIISNLEKDVRYGVTMLSSSSSQSSHRSVMKYGTPTNSDLSVAAIVGIVIGAVFVGAFVISGFIFAYRMTKHGITKIRKPYVIDIPQLEKYKPRISVQPSVVADSSPTSSTGSSRFTNNSQQALLPPQHSKEVDCHTNPVQNNSGKSNNGQTKRQNSQDSGKGGSLSTEPDTPDRLDPVPEDETSPYTVPGGVDYTSKTRDASVNGSSVNNPYAVVHTTDPDCQTSVEQSQSSAEQDREERTVRDSSSEIQMNPTEITVMFVGATSPGRESAGAADGYTCHDQIMCAPGSGVVQPVRTGETAPSVTKDTGPVITTSDDAVQPGILHTLSNESGGESQESPAPEGNSSGPLMYTLMDTSSGSVDPVGSGPDTSRQLATPGGVISTPQDTSSGSGSDSGSTSAGDGYSSQDNMGMLPQDTNNTQEGDLPCVMRTDSNNSTPT